MKYPILLPNIFDHPFTYESSIDLKLGDYVEVPFGKSKITGVVWDEFEKNSNKTFKIKKVLRKLDVIPLKKKTIKFLNWFSEYNIIPKGMTLKLILLNSHAIDEFLIIFLVAAKANGISYFKDLAELNQKESPRLKWAKIILTKIGIKTITTKAIS